MTTTVPVTTTTAAPPVTTTATPVTTTAAPFTTTTAPATTAEIPTQLCQKSLILHLDDNWGVYKDEYKSITYANENDVLLINVAYLDLPNAYGEEDQIDMLSILKLSIKGEYPDTSVISEGKTTVAGFNADYITLTFSNDGIECLSKHVIFL